MLCKYGCGQIAIFFLGKHKIPCCSSNQAKCPEIRKKISNKNSGKNNPFYGKFHSEEVKLHLSSLNSGDKNAFYGKTHTEASKKAIVSTRLNHGISYIGKGNPMYGKTRTLAERKAISRTRILLGSASREKNPNWKGGITHSRISEMNTTKYKEWRLSIFTRDNFTCQFCNIRGGELEAHHILSWVDYPNNRYDIDNGQTLCLKCHRTTFKRECNVEKQ